jgi:hypothetical protein
MKQDHYLVDFWSHLDLENKSQTHSFLSFGRGIFFFHDKISILHHNHPLEAWLKA